MKITLVGHDMAPSECFTALAHAIRHDDTVRVVKSFLGYGNTFTMGDAELEKAITGSKLVLIGCSSSEVFAENELRAARMAKELGVPYGFYMDVPFCHMRARPRSFFADVARDASLVAGLLPFDLTSVHQFFPKADLVNTGNPMRDKMAFPTYSRMEVRDRFVVDEETLFIVAPGGKFTMGNSLVWLTLLEAAELLDRKVLIGFSPHPGDPSLHAVNARSGVSLNPYREFVRNARGKVHAVYFERKVMATTDAIAGADIVVDFTGAGSVAAAYQRIPLVNALPEIWLREFERESGGVPIETVANSSAVAVNVMTPDVLAAAMHRLTTLESHREMQRRAQERAYPRPASPTGSLDALVTLMKRYCS